MTKWSIVKEGCTRHPDREWVIKTPAGDFWGCERTVQDAWYEVEAQLIAAYL